MGQYFKPVNVDKMELVHAHTLKDGLKLMEHSYVDNNVMNVVEDLLLNEWSGDRLVWAGDYAEQENEPEHANSEKGNLYSSANETTYKFDTTKMTYKTILPPTAARYFVNLDRKEFVDKLICPVMKYNFQIHPLSLLTASSNGEGGGDYFSEASKEFVGAWCGDHIKAVAESPTAYKDLKAQGFVEIKPLFTEEALKSE